MEFDDQFKLGHLLFSERKCRVCGEVKDLIDGFYLIRKNRKNLISSYSSDFKPKRFIIFLVILTLMITMTLLFFAYASPY